jgi:hypothetical protein
VTSRHVQAPSEMIYCASACLGLPERASDDYAPMHVRPHVLQSGPDVCARTCGQDRQATCVQIGEMANHRRAAFEQAPPHATPQMKFQI